MKKRLLLPLAILFILNVAIILSAQHTFADAVRLGARGEKVKQIQQALVRTGHLEGGVDGIYGPKTEAAVRSFQRSRGIREDGICGSQTLLCLGLGDTPARPASTYTQTARKLEENTGISGS